MIWNRAVILCCIIERKKKINQSLLLGIVDILLPAGRKWEQHIPNEIMQRLALMW